VNLMLLKSLNLVFWPLYCWVIFVLFRRRLGPGAAFFAFLFMLFCPWFFLFKQSVLSDVPFTFLVTAALWALINWRGGGSRQGAWLTLFLACAFASLMVRSAGVALVGAALLVMVFQRRAWGAAALTVAVFLAAGLLQNALGASTSGYFHLLHDPLGWLSKVALGLPSKLAKVVGFYFPVYRGGHPLIAALEAIVALPLLTVAAWGWWRQRRRGGWDCLDAFVVLYLLMILAWPFVEGPRL
jgi:4-amino-4-deoxy-L-arabinose transferase-like glycosyltransferase